MSIGIAIRAARVKVGMIGNRRRYRIADKTYAREVTNLALWLENKNGMGAETYYQIELTRGQIARVSAEDFEDISRFKWYAVWMPMGRRFYAVRKVREGGKRYSVSMHRYIMGFPDGLDVDHVNGDPLDNRRCNLRHATHQQNTWNRGKQRNNTSGYKGVIFSKEKNRWMARIWVGGRSAKHLGYFDTPEAAHEAYTKASIEYHGEFSRVA